MVEEVGVITNEQTDSDKLLLRALRGDACPRPPIWLMRQAGRYLPEYRALRSQTKSFLDLCFTPELAIEITLQPIRRYGFDGAILFSDILVVPHALGQRVWFEEGSGPRLEPIRNQEALAGLSSKRLPEMLAPVFETIAGLRQKLPPETALIGFAGAPWTVATYMIEGGTSKDFRNTKAWAYSDADGFQQLIDILVEATTDYLIAQIGAGAEVVQLFDTWAGVLPEDRARRYCLEPAKAIIQRIRAVHPEVPIILFPRGVGVLYHDFASSSGADGLSLDTGMPLAWAHDQLQDKVALQGNLDPLLLVSGGAAMEEGVARILDAFGAGRFIFNLGHGLTPEADPDQVAKLVELVRDHGR